MITLALWAVLWGVLAWLFKAVFPLPEWIKTTGFWLCAVICGYYCVLLILTVLPLPLTH
jgi:hypothetical protein